MKFEVGNPEWHAYIIVGSSDLICLKISGRRFVLREKKKREGGLGKG